MENRAYEDEHNQRCSNHQNNLQNTITNNNQHQLQSYFDTTSEHQCTPDCHIYEDIISPEGDFRRNLTLPLRSRSSRNPEGIVEGDPQSSSVRVTSRELLNRCTVIDRLSGTRYLFFKLYFIKISLVFILIK